MSAVKLYIGSELADFNEVFNVMFSIGDIRNPAFGNANKSYTLKLPLTKTNKRLIKFISQIDVKSEPSATARLYKGEMLVIQGLPIIQNPTDYYADLTISSDFWIDDLKELKMTSLDLSIYNHTFDHSNVEDSWSAAYPAYRYPMIDFGGLATGEYGSTAKWLPNDFIPMISIATLITFILKPYTIISDWLATAKVKDAFILGKEIIAEDDFLLNKGLSLATTNTALNYEASTVPGNSQGYIWLVDRTITFTTVTLDEASALNYNNTLYVIPVTGTYRFRANIITFNTAKANASLTILDETLEISIINKSDGTDHIVKQFIAAAYTGTELIEDVTHLIDTGYCHFTAGDEVRVEIDATCAPQNNVAGVQSVTLGVKDTSTLINVWDNVNKYTGLNKTVVLSELLPDISQLDFLVAIRDCYNLSFWMDKSKGNIYIEPDFNTSNIVDLTALLDNESPGTELISPNFNKTIALRWSKDTDEAFNDYLKSNVEGPGRKDVVLTSLFAQKGFKYIDHPFSTLITGKNQSIAGTVEMPRIWNVVPISPFMIFARKTGFNTRLVKWSGLTSGFTWYFETETKSTWPKIEGITWSELFADYWQKTYHYIDKGKILTYRIKTNPIFLSQFLTVISDAEKEGFRPTYRISGNDFILQKNTTDGDISELELILK